MKTATPRTTSYPTNQQSQPPPTTTSFEEAKLNLQIRRTKTTTRPEAQGRNAVKLYLHIDGNTSKAKWIISKMIASSP
ncbi:hypothetical protein FF2_039405 [Malus domestica]